MSTYDAEKSYIICEPVIIYQQSRELRCVFEHGTKANDSFVLKYEVNRRLPVSL